VQDFRGGEQDEAGSERRKRGGTVGDTGSIQPVAASAAVSSAGVGDLPDQRVRQAANRDGSTAAGERRQGGLGGIRIRQQPGVLGEQAEEAGEGERGRDVPLSQQPCS
jgi:hypothetical protein